MAKKNPEKGKELEKDYLDGKITLDQYLSCKVLAATPAPLPVEESPEKVVKDYFSGKIGSVEEYRERFSRAYKRANRGFNFIAGLFTKPVTKHADESPEKVVKDYFSGEIDSEEEYNERFSRALENREKNYDIHPKKGEVNPRATLTLGIIVATLGFLPLINLFNYYNKSDNTPYKEYAVVQQVAESMTPYYSHPEGYTLEERREAIVFFIDEIGKASETLPASGDNLAEIVQDLSKMQGNSMLLNDPEAYGVLLEHYHRELMDILP